MKIQNAIKQLSKIVRQSHSEVIIACQLVLILASAFMIGRLTTTVVEVSSTYGNRELPIYSVGTDEKKIAISFDAAWGDVR